MEKVTLTKTIKKQIATIGLPLLNSQGCNYYLWNGTRKIVDRGMFAYPFELPYYASRFEFYAEVK